MAGGEALCPTRHEKAALAPGAPERSTGSVQPLSPVSGQLAPVLPSMDIKMYPSGLIWTEGGVLLDHDTSSPGSVLDEILEIRPDSGPGGSVSLI